MLLIKFRFFFLFLQFYDLFHKDDGWIRLQINILPITENWHRHTFGKSKRMIR